MASPTLEELREAQGTVYWIRSHGLITEETPSGAINRHYEDGIAIENFRMTLLEALELRADRCFAAWEQASKEEKRRYQIFAEAHRELGKARNENERELARERAGSEGK